MIPKQLRQPPWLLPAAILGFCLGGFLLTVFFFPEFAPEMRGNMARRGLLKHVPFLGAITAISPVVLLWWCVREDEVNDK